MCGPWKGRTKEGQPWRMSRPVELRAWGRANRGRVGLTNGRLGEGQSRWRAFPVKGRPEWRVGPAKGSLGEGQSRWRAGPGKGRPWWRAGPAGSTTRRNVVWWRTDNDKDIQRKQGADYHDTVTGEKNNRIYRQVNTRDVWNRRSREHTEWEIQNEAHDLLFDEQQAKKFLQTGAGNSIC